MNMLSSEPKRPIQFGRNFEKGEISFSCGWGGGAREEVKRAKSRNTLGNIWHRNWALFQVLTCCVAVAPVLPYCASERQGQV